MDRVIPTFLYASTLILSLVTRVVYAAPIESWECRSRAVYHWNDILVRATVDPGRESGSIKVAGVVHNTVFAINGFDRRWDFGLNERAKYDYAFVIKPTGLAAYYDFTNDAPGAVVEPSLRMNCRQKP